MYVSKGKPKISTPYIFQTNEPRITKIGLGHLGPRPDPIRKIWFRSVHRNRSYETPVSCRFYFFLFFNFLFFYRATDRTAEPILMVDGSNDVFSREEVPFGGHVDM